MKKGFTLIELLVVISIIAILSSIVLASLKTSKDKAKDAAIKQELVNLRTQAALYYAKNGDSYNTGPIGTCGGMFLDPEIRPYITKLQDISGVSGVSCYVSDTGGAYAVATKLVTSPAFQWCVDSASKSLEIRGDLIGPSCGATMSPATLPP